MSHLITPHGGTLVDLYATAEEIEQLTHLSHTLTSWNLNHRQQCDIELLLNGGFSPLQGFMSQADYESVLEKTRLRDGTLWPMPIVLDVDHNFASTVANNEQIALRDAEGVLIAILQISDKWQADKPKEAKAIFNSDDQSHAGVNYLFQQAGDIYLGGKLTGVSPPAHYDYAVLRNSPKELREKFIKRGWAKIIAYQTHQPMHRQHQQLSFAAAQENEANLLIHPVVGTTYPDDVDHYSRVRCYQHIMQHYPKQTTMLSLLPLAMRMGGPREALWHAIVQQNYGCTHFIVEHNLVGTKNNSQNENFYRDFQDELGIQILPVKKMVYVENKAEYHPINMVKNCEKTLDISAAELRHRLNEGLEVPTWFSYPEVIDELRKTHPPKHRQGFTVFFTGLSGAGKSTIANALLVKFLEMGRRRVTLLDGDIVRQHLSSELGFSKAHRNLNIERIGFVASEITKNGGIAICAPIAPYADSRKKVRTMISKVGGFVEVFISTPLEICEKRDRKGLYAKARKGIIKEFTGISAPYEAPLDPELIINTSECSAEEATHKILLKLESLGFIR